MRSHAEKRGVKIGAANFLDQRKKEEKERGKTVQGIAILWILFSKGKAS